MTHLTGRGKSSKFTSKTISTSKPKISKFLTGFKPTSKKRASKASAFSSKKSSKKFSLKTAKMPKKSLVSKFISGFKSTSKFSKTTKSFTKKPKSVFISSGKKLSKNTPEISAFIASASIPKFQKQRKVGKSAVFSAKLKSKPQPQTTISTVTSGQPNQDLLSILIGLAPSKPTPISPSIPKTGTSFPPTPEPTSGDTTSIFDDIADFFSNFFGGSGASSQEKASDSGSITTINFSPVSLPSQDVPDTGEGIIDIVPKESFGIGIGGVSTEGEGDDKDGILNSIVNDPIKLGLAVTAIIGGIAGFTGGK